MKKISNVEVKLINLNANDVIATSVNNEVGNKSILIGARDYYEDEEEIW